MPRAGAFEAHHGRYDAWYEAHGAAYQSELLAVRALAPVGGRGLEIGVGTGRFAAPLGVRVGLDPSPAMLGYARRRGIAGVRGAGEALPFRACAFDWALVTTTLCFLDDIPAALREAHRVLVPRGTLVIGFVDRSGRMGPAYLEQHRRGVFFCEATPCTAQQLERWLMDARFVPERWVQTVTAMPEDMTAVEPARRGRGDGLFVVVRAAAR